MSDPTVFVVDDAPEVRDGISTLLESVGVEAECYASAEDFLAAVGSDRRGCVVLDMRMPGMTGLELQAELARRGIGLPIVFLTAHGDVPMAVQAMKGGAADFLTKPVDAGQLIDRIRAALARSRADDEREASRRLLRARLESLTRREQDVLKLAVAGHPNKEIASMLGISHRTVEVHRSHILEKTGANSLLELAHLVSVVGSGRP